MAEHKAEENATTDTTLITERVKSVAAIVTALYFVLNTVLSAFNINPLPFTNEDVASAVSSVGAVVMTIIVWWRQNVITRAAGEGHKITTLIKTGAYEQGTDAAPVTAEPVTTTGATATGTVLAGDAAPLSTADDIADAFARLHADEADETDGGDADGEH